MLVTNKSNDWLQSNWKDFEKYKSGSWLQVAIYNDYIDPQRDQHRRQSHQTKMNNSDKMHLKNDVDKLM